MFLCIEMSVCFPFSLTFLMPCFCPKHCRHHDQTGCGEAHKRRQQWWHRSCRPSGCRKALLVGVARLRKIPAMFGIYIQRPNDLHLFESSCLILIWPSKTLAIDFPQNLTDLYTQKKELQMFPLLFPVFHSPPASPRPHGESP